MSGTGDPRVDQPPPRPKEALGLGGEMDTQNGTGGQEVETCSPPAEVPPDMPAWSRLKLRVCGIGAEAGRMGWAAHHQTHLQPWPPGSGSHRVSAICKN